jgi:hypothetical protein
MLAGAEDPEQVHHTGSESLFDWDFVNSDSGMLVHFCASYALFT